MGVAFSPGDTIGRGDLDIFLTNSHGNPTNAAEITYAIYYVDPGPPETEVLIGDPARIPVNPAVGEYYASLMAPAGASAGDYHIRWTFREFVSSPQVQVVQEFAIVHDAVTVSPTYSRCATELIYTLRLLLRDQNPDKFYHFRPPEFEGDIGQYNRIFGQIWEDAELHQYLERGLDWWNMHPPDTCHSLPTLNGLCTDRKCWREAVFWAAIHHACFALSLNWIADEFDYSIGGVSLSIEKSSKYQSMADAASAQFDKAAEAKARTVKFIRGLKQPRFGIGVRSAFGPYVGKGVLSPRSFM